MPCLVTLPQLHPVWLCMASPCSSLAVSLVTHKLLIPLPLQHQVGVLPPPTAWSGGGGQIRCTGRESVQDRKEMDSKPVPTSCPPGQGGRPG